MTFVIIPIEQTPRVPVIEDIELFYIQHLKELEAFLEYAKSRSDAIGLAANQVSVDNKRFMLRVFAIKNIVDNTCRLIINPVINEYVGIKELKSEGCLTWTGMLVVAERSRAIRVSYYNEIGEKIRYELHKGLDAQVWQHEINHLNGIEERIEERWFEVPKPIEVGRNEKCPCLSGKKYKNCCFLYL
jgi:peptide deformylase